MCFPNCCERPLNPETLVFTTRQSTCTPYLLIKTVRSPSGGVASTRTSPGFFTGRRAISLYGNAVPALGSPLDFLGLDRDVKFPMSEEINIGGEKPL